jgi:hypothetical protein
LTPPARFFCSELSRSHGEEIYGTAPIVKNWLLLETPGAWSAKALPVDRLPRPVIRHFELLAQQIPHTRRLLIRQRHTHHNNLSLFLIRATESAPASHRVRLSTYEDLLTIDRSALTNAPAPEIAPRYLVCTHGKHDKCCAKFGFATYCALKEHAGESVWQCSHVGGDRFAANVLFMPHGIYYGNVFPQDIPALINAGERNEISLKHYRGRSCYSRPAQVGEYLIRSRTGILGLDDLLWLDNTALTAGEWLVRFSEPRTSTIHEVAFRSEPSPFTELLTCHASEPSTVSQYQSIRFVVP